MKQRLYKSRTEKKLAGVAGGFGEYLNIDPTIVRIIFILLTFLHGIGALLYLICLIIVPKEPLPLGPKNKNDSTGTDDTVRSNKPANDYEAQELEKRSSTSGWVLVSIGVLFFLVNVIPSFTFFDALPLLVIALGVWLLMRAVQHNGRTV